MHPDHIANMLAVKCIKLADIKLVFTIPYKTLPTADPSSDVCNRT